LQTAIRAVFPPECLCCSDRVESAFAICGKCWGDTPFVVGAICGLCGVPLPGKAERHEVLRCDDCLSIARPWQAGRAVFVYAGNARRLVLGLKHGDRADVARAAGPWLARAGADLLAGDPLIVPMPLHWRRLLTRRFNQSALLAHALARETGLQCLPDGLVRVRATPPQDNRNLEARFANLQGAIRPHPRRGAQLAGRKVLLIDDVMTSGASLAAATGACLDAGATGVCVMALARVAKDA